MENTKLKPPKNWLVESILVTLFCCLPLGIVAIINSSKVESKFYAGDIDGANEAAKQAKRWTTWSFALMFVFWILYIMFFVFVTAMSEL